MYNSKLFKIFKKCYLIGAEGGESVEPTKKHKGTFAGDILYFDCTSGYIHIYIDQTHFGV